jgi:cobalt-zinc-cadmium efflux system protein
MHFAGQEHQHPKRRSLEDQRRLAGALALVAMYMLAEVVGGLWANSLALLADAGHMLSDCAALALSVFAIWIARRPATPRRSYGYYRAEILAALVNGATLIAISIFIFVEAAQRLVAPPRVEGELLMLIALGGLVVNVLGLWIVAGRRSESLNVRGAWLHMASDALGSVAAIAAGLGVWAFSWNWVDPIASILIGLLVIRSAWHLVSEAVAILMESTPGHIDVDQVRDRLMALPGTSEVHDLHIWTITSGVEALSAHVVIEDGCSHDALLKQIREELYRQFGIDHITIQLEPLGFEERRAVF